jgi:hypothetical protein
MPSFKFASLRTPNTFCSSWNIKISAKLYSWPAMKTFEIVYYSISLYVNPSSF